MKKTALSLLLAIFMVLSTFAVININSVAASVDDLVYSVNTYGESKTVTITACNKSASGELIIPDTIEGYPVTRIGDHAFSNCENLKSITLPDTITYLGDFAFSGAGFEEFTIPDSVTSLGERVFSSCDNLKKIVIGKGLKSAIDKWIFIFCNNLSYISVSNENEYYSSDENGVLFNKEKTTLIVCPMNYNNTEYVIPESVTSISHHAFDGCINLESIKIPDSVTSIGACAFSGASALSDIVIPDSVQFIDGGLLSVSMYSSLKKGLFTGTAYYDNQANWENGILYCGNHAVGCASYLEEFELREGTIGIAGDAFSHLRGVENITIPESVKYIGDWAFDGVGAGTQGYGIESVTILGQVTSIGECVFYNCNKLTSVTLPDSVTFIGNSAFSECYSLTSINLPADLKKIDNFAFEGCSRLETMYIPAGVEFIGSYVFQGCKSLRDVYYAGSEKEWSLIEKGYTDLRDAATIHYNDTCTHSFIGTKEAVAATCTKNGNSGDVICLACEKVVVAGAIVPATGHHTFGEWTVATAPTISAEGVEERVCTVCGEKETRAIEKLSYTIGDINGDNDITAADARLALRISAGLDTLESVNAVLEMVDYNGDKQITAADARKILRKSAGLE